MTSLIGSENLFANWEIRRPEGVTFPCLCPRPEWNTNCLLGQQWHFCVLPDHVSLLRKSRVEFNSLLTFRPCLQISTLVQHRSEQPQHGAATVASEKALRAIGRVGQSVNLAMERFVAVADKIGDDNPDIKKDMYEACKEARTAGEWELGRANAFKSFCPGDINCHNDTNWAP